MAKDDDDMTGRDAATANETAATARARHRALTGDAAPSAAAIGEAVAKAMERMRNEPVKEEHLPEVVRASVRCGYETTRRVMGDGSAQLVTAPGSITFQANETPDGRACTVVHGRPVKLKRDAFLRYRREGKVVLAQ